MWLIESKFLSDMENEDLTLEVNTFTFMLALIFPKENITRKMLIFSMILPGLVRTFKMAHLMLKLE